jgi:hypothetical protein
MALSVALRAEAAAHGVDVAVLIRYAKRTPKPDSRSN